MLVRSWRAYGAFVGPARTRGRSTQGTSCPIDRPIEAELSLHQRTELWQAVTETALVAEANSAPETLRSVGARSAGTQQAER